MSGAVIPITQGDQNWNAHFGVCPECHKSDGFINVGRGHWFYCAEHRKKWFVGSNLFSSWREKTLDQQQEIYERLRFGQLSASMKGKSHERTWAIRY